MKAPLPEVPAHVPKKRDFAKAPLLSLSLICATKALIALLYPILDTPDPEMTRFWHWTMEGVIAALSLWLIYYLWLGYGWARGVWLWITALFMPLSLLPMELTYQKSQAEQVLSNFDVVFSLSTLVYLNLPLVKAHFARRQEG